MGSRCTLSEWRQVQVHDDHCFPELTSKAKRVEVMVMLNVASLLFIRNLK